MEDRKLNRVFDRVKLSQEREEAMLADLLRGKKEVSSMKQTNRRRIPAAALAAAVLVVVLAGTAIAAEYLGRINIELLDGFAGDPGEWYSAYMDGGRVPADSLSEAVWAASASADERGDIYLAFDSRQEAEAFLGLDLADNALLERMPVNLITYSLRDQTAIQGNCIMEVVYTSEQIPAVVTLESCYTEEGSACIVNEFIEFGTDIASEGFEPGIHASIVSEGDFQVYVTSSGMEVTIYSEADNTIYAAYFAKDNVFYSISIYNSDWDTLIEILEAYE